MTEYDLRQYRLMLENLDSPMDDMRKLGKVLNNLQDLLSVLEDKDELWESQFTRLWWIVEEIYAYNLAEKIEKLVEPQKKQINEIRLKLIEHVNQRIAQVIRDTDS